MNRFEFTIIIALVLFAVFLLGWFTSRVTYRLVSPASTDTSELDLMAQQLQDAEQARDDAIIHLENREAEMARRFASQEAEMQAMMGALRDARIEAEDMRNYADQLRAER